MLHRVPMSGDGVPNVWRNFMTHLVGLQNSSTKRESLYRASSRATRSSDNVTLESREADFYDSVDERLMDTFPASDAVASY